MIIQPRDVELLAQLSRYGILSTRQLQEQVFKNINHTTVMRRLRKLENESLIIRNKGLPLNESAWSLSVLGGKYVEVEKPTLYTNQNTIFHEVTLSNVRLKLEKLGLGSDFVSEASLRRNEEDEATAFRNRITSNIPDGIFVAEVGDENKVVALELELHSKSHARLKKVFEDYRVKTSVHFVWYVVGSKQIGTLVTREWNKINSGERCPKLLVTELNDLNTNSDHAKIVSSHGNVLAIAEFFRCNPPLLSPDGNSCENPRTGAEQENSESLSSHLNLKLESNQ